MGKLKRLKVLYRRYEGLLIPLALFSGFATDLLTFKLIRFETSIFFLFGHLLFAGINIVVINYFKNNKPANNITSYWKLFAPLFVQFSFGNMFSGFLIFYSQSGSIFASWPFLLVIIGLLIGNEVVRRYDLGPEVQIGAYFFALFAYFNLALPYIFKVLNVPMFLISGLISLLVISVFLYVLTNYIEEIRNEKNKLYMTVTGIFVLVNILYFTNMIPPIPLTLKGTGVYHSIDRIDDNYEVVTEKCQNWDKCLFTREIRNISEPPQSIYFYSAVYSPPEMDLEIAHRWQKYNDDQGEWETEARIPFQLQGGRDIGFRWYSYYTVSPGLWRVVVETRNGQVIGRDSFYIKEGSTTKVTKEI
ncbi:MAG: DUF2914 domain-containing protein [Patescibacteria group bacterium]